MERGLAFDFSRLNPVSLLLREPDFSTAGEMSGAINREFGHAVASARDSGRVEVDPSATGVANLTAILARIENLAVAVQPARPGRGQRTHRDDRDGERRESRSGIHSARRLLGPDLNRVFRFPARAALERETEVVGQTDVQAKDSPAKRLEIGEGASIDELVSRIAEHGRDRARRDFDLAGHQGGGSARCRPGSDLKVVGD